MPRSTFYYYLKASKTDKYIAEKQAIIELYEQNKQRYGYRRITALLRQNNINLNHKTVLKLMKSLNIRGKRRKNEQYHSYKGEVGKVTENILNRDFTASKPFEKLTTDVTQFKVCNDKVYLSPVMDLYNREIVAYSISLSPDLAQIREMLQGLTEKLPEGATPIFHSDQGWQYQHKQYQRMLREKGIRQSMSRKGNCLDNAVMENFFGLLKSELLYLQEFQSMEHFKLELYAYLDYYNNQRIKAKLKGLPPAIHRQQALSAA